MSIKKIINKISIKTVLYASMVTFSLILSFFIIPFPDSIRRVLFPVAGGFGMIFLILGAILALLGKREKIKCQRVLYMITGTAAISVFLFTILHNLFYALAIVFPKTIVLFEILHVSSFMISLVIAPIIFMIGSVSILFLDYKNSKTSKNN